MKSNDNLKLDEADAIEVDIGDYRNNQDDLYISHHIPTSSRLTSPISSSSDLSPSPSPWYGGTPPVPSYLDSLRASGKASATSLSQLSSPSSSSHALVRTGNGSKLSLVSNTLPPPPLPRSVQPAPKRKLEIEGLVIDPSVLEKLRRWILGIAVVEFDIDHGPVVEGIFPPLFLLPTESENIAFSAFPDSLQFDQGSQVHSFRIREQISSSLSVEELKRPPTKDGFIYGFSHFTQKKDASVRRGYRQHSIVILTQYQYPAFYTYLVSIFGPLYDTHGLPMLESACHNIATWRGPSPGQTMELGFLGTVLYLEIPNTIDEQQLTETSSFKEKYDPRLHILASSPPLIPPPISLFQSCLAHLWSIWECIVLCEPILIIGSSPAQTSQAVWWFRDLLRPLPLAGDIRPYFTMQDGDHALLVNKLPPKAGVILGVTNPFFEKSCSHWPHILSLGRNSEKTEHNIMGKASPSRGTTKSSNAGRGWKTKTHKRHISKDRVLLKQLEAACKGNEQTRLNASVALRGHFCSRTRDFLAPLSRYLHTLIPSPAEVTSAGASGNLRMKPFNSKHFIASLKANGSTLPFRSLKQRTDFYERWLRTPTFGLWLGQQEQIVHVVLEESIRRL
ncbi:hypothetical protein JOM56_001054 [Amanita muscaria]